jgi:hypothetical protein
MKKSATKITGATMGLAAFLGLGTTASAAQSQPGCALVPVATVDSVYGVKVGAPTAVSKPPVTVCTYDSLQPIVSVLVRFQVGENAQQFQAARKQFGSHGLHTTTREGLGQRAYSSVFGYGKNLTSTIVVLTGSTELLISGSGPLSKAELLARKVLPKL